MTRTILSSLGTTSRRATAAGRGIFSSPSITVLLASVLVLATSSCGGANSSIVGSKLQDVQSFQVAAGDNQVGTAGSDLPTPITVRALTQGGQGVSGISVQWTFSGGGGTLTPGGTISKSLTTVTNKQGKSSVYWQLDTIAGDQTATATLAGTSSNSATSVKFHSRGKAGGPAALVVSPAADTLAVGDSAQFTAKVLDRWKNVISGATVSWSSSNDSVVTVSPTGMAKALRSGSAKVIATTGASPTSAAGSSSISGGASVKVESSLTTGTGASQTSSVTTTPASLSFTFLNATAQLSAVAKDSTGNTVTNPGFTWKSLATSIATVSTTGLVTARAVGATAIIVTAACCGSDTAAVTVDTLTSSGQPAPYFQDSFESGNLSHTQNGFRWTGSTRTVVSSDYARTGKYSLKFHYDSLGTGGTNTSDAEHWAEQDFALTPKGTPGPKEVWVQYYVRFPENGDYSYAPFGTHDEKLFAIWGENYSGTDPNAVIQWEGSASDAQTIKIDEHPVNHGGKYFTQNNPLFYNSQVKGQWVQVRIHVRVGNGSTDWGVFEGWMNGVQKFYGPDNSVDQFYIAGGNNYWRRGYLLGYMNSGFPVNTNFYIDDFTVWTTNPGWPNQH